MSSQLFLIDIRPVVRVVFHRKRARVQPDSPGFDPGWFVAFPHDLREVGAVFRVSRLIAIASRRYYRAIPPFVRL